MAYRKILKLIIPRDSFFLLLKPFRNTKTLFFMFCCAMEDDEGTFRVLSLANPISRKRALQRKRGKSTTSINKCKARTPNGETGTKLALWKLNTWHEIAPFPMVRLLLSYHGRNSYEERTNKKENASKKRQRQFQFLCRSLAWLDVAMLDHACGFIVTLSYYQKFFSLVA